MSFSWPKTELSSAVMRKALRQATLEQIFVAKSGHPGGSLSLIEILAAIYDGNFVASADEPYAEDRDRLVLSKGHGVPSLYSVLSALGFIDPAELSGLRSLGHRLQGHPDRSRYDLMEASTGSLGQGASVALGLALGLRLKFREGKLNRLPRVYCILGDGEMQEGQVWECLMAAGKFKPGNLIFVLDRNRGQIDGPVADIMSLDPLDKKIEAFNLDATVIDGHDVDALKREFRDRAVTEEAKPRFVIAETVKGKGVSFMEHPTDWHGAAPNREQMEKAIAELSGSSVVGTGDSMRATSPFGRVFP